MKGGARICRGMHAMSRGRRSPGMRSAFDGQMLARRVMHGVMHVERNGATSTDARRNYRQPQGKKPRQSHSRKFPSTGGLRAMHQQTSNFLSHTLLAEVCEQSHSLTSMLTAHNLTGERQHHCRTTNSDPCFFESYFELYRSLDSKQSPF